MPLKLEGIPVGSSVHFGVTSPRNLVAAIVYRPHDDKVSRTFAIELSPTRKWELTYAYWSCINRKPMDKTVTLSCIGDGWVASDGGSDPPTLLKKGGIFTNIGKNLLISVVGFTETSETPTEGDEVCQLVYQDDPFHKKDKYGKPVSSRAGPFGQSGSFGELGYPAESFFTLRSSPLCRLAVDLVFTKFIYEPNPKPDLLALVPQFEIVNNGEGDVAGVGGSNPKDPGTEGGEAKALDFDTAWYGTHD